MNTIHEQLNLIGIIPVVVIDDSNNAESLAQVLYESGLSTMEITFRTDAAEESIERISKTYPAIILGAGTVLNIEQVKTAIDCGAKYIVSPGFNCKVVEYCFHNNIPVIPGITTPTEIESAMEMDLKVVKFFPAEAAGGIDYLKAISAPYKMVKFIPTGGIDESNFLPYLKLPQVLACGGSWMVKAEYIKTKRFDDIKILASTAVSKMFGFQLLRMGINDADKVEAAKNASLLCQWINLPIKESDSSIFVGTQFEFLKSLSIGKHGYIDIGTNFIDRAIAYFENKGIAVRRETMVKKNDRISSVFLNIEIGGFAVHLIQL